MHTSDERTDMKRFYMFIGSCWVRITIRVSWLCCNLRDKMATRVYEALTHMPFIQPDFVSEDALLIAPSTILATASGTLAIALCPSESAIGAGQMQAEVPKHAWKCVYVFCFRTRLGEISFLGSGPPNQDIDFWDAYDHHRAILKHWCTTTCAVGSKGI